MQQQQQEGRWPAGRRALAEVRSWQLVQLCGMLIIAAPLLLPSLSPSPPPLSPPPPPARLMEITFDVIPVPLALRDSEAVPHTHESRKLASALSLEELTTLLRDRLPPEVDPRAVALRRHGSSFSVSISTPSTDTFAVLEVD